MPSDIALFFDDATESKVREMWNSLAKSGVSSYMIDTGARPHVSLAIWEQIRDGNIERDLAAFARENTPIDISLVGIGVFPTPAGVVFLIPAITCELTDLHIRFHERFASAGTSPFEHYLPGRWLPHCSLAQRMSPEKTPAALDVCRKFEFPITGKLVQIGHTKFPPTEHVYTANLGDN